MNKEMEKKLVPNLRFPEFKTDKSWEGQPLGKVSKLVRGPFGGALKKEIFVKNGFAVYEQFHAIYEDFSSFRYYVDEEKFLELKRFSVSSGDLIMSCSGTMGKFAKIPQNFKQGIINQALLKLSVKEDKNIDFIKLSLELPTNQEKLLSQSAGGAIKNVVSVDQIRELNLSIPNPKEQQKIAECISSLNDLITGEEEKLGALKNQKKGLMQQLFPAEGEKVPKLRFPEFKESGEWEEKELIKLADKKIRWSFIGGPFGSNLKASDYTSNGVRIIQLQNIGEGKFLDNYKIFTSEKKADELLSCNIYSGDIILSKMGDPVGRACIIPENLPRAVMASDGIRFVIDEVQHNKYFIFTLINSEKIREAIDKRATGSTRKRIGLDELKQIPLLIPRSKNEQKKIADLIHSLDTQISSNKNKISSLKLHKKGLMQQLFPTRN